MKTFSVILVSSLFIAWLSHATVSGRTGKLLDKVSDAEIKLVTLQTLMDQVKLDGSILIYDQNKRTFYSNDFKWAKQGKLPASTFKIPNSIIALETGVVSYDKTVFKWTGEPRRFSSWEQDLSLLDAFHYSCVPCYQDVARCMFRSKPAARFGLIRPLISV